MIARETLADLELSIDEHCAEITVLDLPTVRADPAQMRQLFLNLLGNALKFAREGEAPRITVSARCDEERIDLSFEDNGIGFEQKYAERIFKPFQRLHASGRYPGSGIGLAICKKIVERHGGTISAKSEPGRGATFLVSLPVSPSWHDESESELR
jgi:signal transduction histidine kinase